jgi:hypothetical protein
MSCAIWIDALSEEYFDIAECIGWMSFRVWTAAKNFVQERGTVIGRCTYEAVDDPARKHRSRMPQRLVLKRLPARRLARAATKERWKASTLADKQPKALELIYRKLECPMGLILPWQDEHAEVRLGNKLWRLAMNVRSGTEQHLQNQMAVLRESRFV